MMGIGRNFWLLFFGIALVLHLAGLAPASTEVGVSVDPEDSQIRPNGLYVLAQIVEDPDTFPSWQRHAPPGIDNRIVLNSEGHENGDGKPSILYNPVSELPVVAWSRNSVSGFDVVVSHFTGGAWTQPEVVAGSAADELDPTLALDPVTGTVHLFYWVDEATSMVMHRQAPANLSSWSVPVQVSDPGDAARRPSSVVHDGVLHVAYEVHNFGSGQTPRQVVLAHKEQGEFVPDVMAITYFTGKVRPEVHSASGRIWVDWIDAAGEMAWTRHDSQGQWEPARYEPNSSAQEREYLVRGAIRLKAIQDP